MPEESVVHIPLGQIQANPHQPRRTFGEAELAELAESIREYGILQPLRVRPTGDHRYEIIMGERRFRAARLAGLERVPALITLVDDREALELAIIENVQRVDVGPLEAAVAYQRLVTEFGQSHEDIGRRVGKSRSSIANTIRLLKLGDAARKYLANGSLSEGHARALLSVADPNRQAEIAGRAVRESWNVRRTEREVGSRVRARPAKSGYSDGLSRALSEHLGAIATVEKGQIVIRYSSDEELERIFETLGVVL